MKSKMNNVLEFYIKMKDMMSGGLIKLAQTSKQTFSKIQSDTRQAESAAGKYRNTLGYLYDKMNDLKRFRMDEALGKKQIIATTKEIKKLQSEIDKLEGKASSGGGGLLRKLAPYASAAAIFAAAISFSKASIAQYADFEKSTRTYQVMTGNKGIGTSVAAGLNDLKQNSILGTQVYPTAQMLMAFGDRADQVIPHIKMLGDVSMGDADKLHRLAYAFGEVESTGSLTGRQLMQMTNAGFNPLLEISRKTGESMEELRKKMAKHQITFKEVEQAFESATGKGGRFHDMLNQMADTTSVKMLMLKGKVAALEIAVGERLAPAFKHVTDVAIGFVGWLKHLVEIPIEKKLQDEIDRIRVLQGELRSSNTSHQRQVDILNELKDINPNIVKGINEQNIAYGKLASNINEVTTALRNKITVETFDKNNGGIIAKYEQASKTFDEADAKAKTIALAALPDSILNRKDLTDNQKMLLGKKILYQQSKDLHPPTYWRRMGYRTPYETYTDAIDERTESNDYMKKHGSEYAHGINVMNTLNKSLDGVLGVGNMNAVASAKDVLGAANAIKNVTKNFGGNKKLVNEFLSLRKKVAGEVSSGAINAADINRLSDLSKKQENDGDAGSGSISKGITGGGPRVININGVKFTDKVEIHANTMNEGFEEAERKLEEMFLRILNSGASVQ